MTPEQSLEKFENIRGSSSHHGAIPAVLRERDQWVVWCRERRDGKQTKVPFCVRTGQRASTTDPQTWSTFEYAVGFARQPGVDGIGYVFAPEDPFFGVDLDDCVKDSDLHPAAAAIVNRLGTYSERSVSGSGVHAIGIGTLNGFPRNRRGGMPWGGGIEIYDAGRFFVVTGDRLPDLPEAPTGCQHALEAVLAELFPAPSPNGQPAASTAPSGRTDAEVLERAFAAKNGAEIQALYRSVIDGYPSHSEADLALLSKLAFWTGPDPEQLDRLFRGSGLMREKWERADYRESTLTKALDSARFYEWAKVTRPPESPESPSPPRGDGEVADSADSLRRSQPVSQVTPGSARGGDSYPESPSPESRPFALPLGEFVAARSEAPAALIGDADEALLPTAGLMLVVAKGGKGKTTLIVELALHLAAGRRWLDFEVPRPLQVLLVENEGPREPFRAKLERRRNCWEHELLGEVFVHTLSWAGFSLTDDGHAASLREFVEQHQVDVVIGDPLDSLGMTGVGSPEDTRKLMGLLQKAGLHRDLAFVLLHHPHKGESSDPLDEASGAWGGKPDTQLNLEKKTGNRARLSFAKVRWSRRGARPALLLAFDPDSESFTVVHEEAAEERDYDVEIAALLADRPWRTPKEVAAKEGGIGANVDLVKNRLEKRPELFVSCTGQEAKARGRHATAVLWGLAGSVQEARGQQELYGEETEAAS